ncbi:hypothetical protein LCGC14_3137090 [marine sediment metagenome]|uniref:Uncharacterized protein n=1 Tax=marine sediment metagenome TaxID=412755 RepID=A0A0F8YMB7_9ZZZZ
MDKQSVTTWEFSKDELIEALKVMFGISASNITVEYGKTPASFIIITSTKYGCDTDPIEEEKEEGE